MKKLSIIVLSILIVVLAFLLIIIFKSNKITIKLMDGDKIIREMKIEKGDVISLPELTKDNYLFAGWYYNNEKLHKSVWFAHDATINAHWEERPPEMTITYNTNGGQEMPTSTIYCHENLNLAIPHKVDCNFVGWLDDQGTVITNETKLACMNITLTAKWECSNIDYNHKKSSYHSLNLEATLTDAGIQKKFNKHIPNNDAITIYLFHGKECSHCHEFLEFINSITSEYGQYFKMEAYEVWHNDNNAKLLTVVSQNLGQKTTSVPYIVIGKKIFKGYSNISDNAIKEAIISLYKTPSNNRYDALEELNIN